MTVLTYEKYNKTKFAVRGDMEKHHPFVKSLNGRVNKRMKGGEGWLVDIKYEKELEEFVRNQNEESDNEQEDDAPVFQAENVYEERFDDDLSSGISTITEESENVEELHTEDDSSDESVFKELEERERMEREERERMERERKELEKEKEKFERQRREREKEYETEREQERLEFKRQKEEFERRRVEQEKEYELELTRRRVEQERELELERQKIEQLKEYEIEREQERLECRQQRDKEKEYETEEKTDTHEIVENEDETVNHRENVNPTELQEMLEYYRKFSKPIKPKTDKNYLAIVKIMNRLNTRVTKLEHKYQKLKRKYSDLKSNKRQ